MKIGLLTFHDTTNFGAFLQTYSLYYVIKEMGHHCEVIDYQCKAIVERELPRNTFEKFSVKAIVKYILVEPMIRKKHKAFRDAMDKYMELSDRYDRTTINQSADDYDIFIAGSDILWDLKLTKGDTTYFLDFVSADKRYSFATSVGERWNKDEMDMVVPLLKEFRRISLREKETADWMGKVLGKKISTVCDPTMLLPEQFWVNFAEQSKIRNRIDSSKYVLLYFASDLIIKDAKKYAKTHGMEVWAVRCGRPIIGVKNIWPCNVEDFVYLVKSAQAVFTASYHGMLFALFFKIPLYCYLGDGRHNNRFGTVLERLKLWDCCRKKDEEFHETNIDYEKIAKEIENWRRESIDVLKSYWDN